ncbi:MAG: ABC transporter substrate-binding protein [Actinomycetota bacterium]|nr:ABC transporter substrate-binding protein [Actinomycetota bacterium]
MSDTESTAVDGLSRRGFLGLAAGTSAGLLAAACSGSSGPGSTTSGAKYTGKYTGPNVTLAYWNGFTGGDGPTMRKMVEDFNAAHSNINVKMTTMQWADYYQKVPAAVSQGKGPDVGIAHQDALAGLAARRSIQPLDDIAKELKLSESDFVAAIWKGGIYKGKRYGIPLDVHSLAQYWNKDLVSKGGQSAPPAKDPDFTAYMTKLKGSSGVTPFWMPSLWPAHLMFMSLVWQFGGEPWGGDGTKATFDSDAGQKALSWMVDQVKKGNSPKNVAIDTQYNAFKTSKNAVTWDGIWQINDLKTTASSLKWDISFLPQIGDQPAVWANGHNFVLMNQANRDQNKQTAAKVFINYISSKSVEWAKSGMIPARNAIRDSAEFKSLTQAVIAKGVDNMHFLPAVPGIGDVQGATMQDAVNKAVLLQQSPKDALTSAAKAANKLLDENRKKFGG